MFSGIAFARINPMTQTIIALVIIFYLSFLSLSYSDSNAQQIVRTMRELQKIPLQYELDWMIPKPARPLLTTLKHQLIQEIVTTLNSDISMSSNNKRLNSMLLSSLRRKGIPLNGNWESSPYGVVYEPNVEKPKGHSDYLVVTTTLPVICGDDSSVYVLKRKGMQWKVILSVESNDYDEISKAKGSLGYAVSPLNNKGEFFLVVADINPWCSSNWQGIRYSVFHIPLEPYVPKMILNKKEIIYLGVDRFFELRAHRDYFDLEFNGSSADPGGSREHTIRYKIVSDTAIRIPPFANNPRDFLDEWATLPWSEASKWSGTGSINHYWHSQLNRISSWDYDSDLKCPDTDEWLLTFDIGSYEKPNVDSDVLYARITQKGLSYFIREIGRTRPHSCN